MSKNKVDLTTVQDINMPGLTECPYCGHDEYYINYRYYGTGVCRSRFDGEEAENGDMYDCLKSTIVGKFGYCSKCQKRIFRIKC